MAAYGGMKAAAIASVAVPLRFRFAAAAHYRHARRLLRIITVIRHES